MLVAPPTPPAGPTWPAGAALHRQRPRAVQGPAGGHLASVRAYAVETSCGTEGVGISALGPIHTVARCWTFTAAVAHSLGGAQQQLIEIDRGHVPDQALPFACARAGRGASKRGRDLGVPRLWRKGSPSALPRALCLGRQRAVGTLEFCAAKLVSKHSFWFNAKALIRKGAPDGALD